jgi:hypothetical protein
MKCIKHVLQRVQQLAKISNILSELSPMHVLMIVYPVVSVSIIITVQILVNLFEQSNAAQIIGNVSSHLVHFEWKSVDIDQQSAQTYTFVIVTCHSTNFMRQGNNTCSSCIKRD